MNLHEIAERFEGVRWHGETGFSCRCPAHDDQHASLSINDGDKAIVLNCHTGCETAAILRTINLTFAHLFHNNGNGHRQGGMSIARTYDYQGADGRLVYQVVRLDPKDFRARRPDGAGGWTWNLKETTRLLYRLPELVKVDPATVVHVVEGEKDADRLGDTGMLATCNPGGAGKWREEYNDALRGRHVVIIPDYDTPGQEHAQAVARTLHGVAASVKIVNLYDGAIPEKHGKDISDWLAEGHEIEELVRLEEAAPEWTPEQTAAKAAPEAAPFPRTDAGNGELLAHLHGDRLRFDHRRGRWLLWTGHRWSPDITENIRQLAKEAARHRYRGAEAVTDKSEKRAEAKWAIDSESRGRLEAAIVQARTEKPITDPGDKWDEDPMLVGCDNGVLQLKVRRR